MKNYSGFIEQKCDWFGAVAGMDFNRDGKVGITFHVYRHFMGVSVAGQEHSMSNYYFTKKGKGIAEDNLWFIKKYIHVLPSDFRNKIFALLDAAKEGKHNWEVL